MAFFVITHCITPITYNERHFVEPRKLKKPAKFSDQCATYVPEMPIAVIARQTLFASQLWNVRKNVSVARGSWCFQHHIMWSLSHIMTFLLLLPPEPPLPPSPHPLPPCFTYNVFQSFFSLRNVYNTCQQTCEWSLLVWYYQTVQLRAKHGYTISG